jgi:hypothetical protein
LVRRRALLKSR